MKKNQSWEDQLSNIYTQMTGVKVDFQKCKDRDRKIRSERRKNDKFLKENGISEYVDKRKATNENAPGYGPRANICNITIAVLPLDFIVNPKRLDAPCEMCINEQCCYSMGNRMERR